MVNQNQRKKTTRAEGPLHKFMHAGKKKISEISREKTAATPRSIAVLSLMKILEEKKLSHIVLRDALSAYPDWTPRDRAFVTRLV